MSSMGLQKSETAKNSNRFKFRLLPLVYHQPWPRSTQIKKAPGTFNRNKTGNSSSSGKMYPSSAWPGTLTRKMMKNTGQLQLHSIITRRLRVSWTMRMEVASREGEQTWRQKVVSNRASNLYPSSCIIAVGRLPVYQALKATIDSWIPLEVTSAIKSQGEKWLTTWRESYLTILAWERNQIAPPDCLKAIEMSKLLLNLRILLNRKEVQGRTLPLSFRLQVCPLDPWSTSWGLIIASWMPEKTHQKGRRRPILVGKLSKKSHNLRTKNPRRALSLIRDIMYPIQNNQRSVISIVLTHKISHHCMFQKSWNLNLCLPAIRMGQVWHTKA